jgi:hypothetical protein
MAKGAVVAGASMAKRAVLTSLTRPEKRRPLTKGQRKLKNLNLKKTGYEEIFVLYSLRLAWVPGA